MDTPCDKSLPPSGRLEGGDVSFYGWALDTENGKQQLSVHTRDRAGRLATNDLLPVWFDTFEAAAAWVTAKNAAARP